MRVIRTLIGSVRGSLKPHFVSHPANLQVLAWNVRKLWKRQNEMGRFSGQKSEMEGGESTELPLHLFTVSHVRPMLLTLCGNS